MICDVCNDDLKMADAKVIPPRQMRQAADNGFGETVTIAGYVAMSASERKAQFKSLAHGDDTDWALCRSCASALQLYLKGSPPAAQQGGGQRPIAGIGLQSLLGLLAGKSRVQVQGAGQGTSTRQKPNSGATDDAQLFKSFRLIQSGDIDGGRHDLLLNLLNATDGIVSLDFLCLAAYEFVREPQDVKNAQIVGKILKAGNVSAFNSLASIGNGVEIDPNDATVFPNLIEYDAAAGPHEAALRLFTLVKASSAMIMIGFCRAGGPQPTKLPNHFLYGAANLHMRDAEVALERFQSIAANPDHAVQAFRENIGNQFDPAQDRELRAVVERTGRIGEALALRELGRFKEALDALLKLQAQSDGLDFLIAPLIAEASSRRDQPSFPAAWRKQFIAPFRTPSTGKTDVPDPPPGLTILDRIKFALGAVILLMGLAGMLIGIYQAIFK